MIHGLPPCTMLALDQHRDVPRFVLLRAVTGTAHYLSTGDVWDTDPRAALCYDYTAAMALVVSMGRCVLLGAHDIYQVVRYVQHYSVADYEGYDMLDVADKLRAVLWGWEHTQRTMDDQRSRALAAS